MMLLQIRIFQPKKAVEAAKDREIDESHRKLLKQLRKFPCLELRILLKSS
jgi:hypothetical protein